VLIDENYAKDREQMKHNEQNINQKYRERQEVFLSWRVRRRQRERDREKKREVKKKNDQ
jgi:hypothetical protein